MKPSTLASPVFRFKRSALTALWLTVGLSISGAACAQVSTVTFKNFRKYPASGLWSQELSGTRNGVSMGPPTKSTSCVAAADPDTLRQLQKIGESNGTACKTNVIADTERLAEYQRTCVVGGVPRITHSTMRAVDDKTLSIDTRDETPGFVQTVMHSNVTYLGTCTAAASKPSAAECAELAASAEEAASAEAQCAEAPAAYRTQCLAQISTARKMTDVLRAQCR